MLLLQIPGGRAAVGKASSRANKTCTANKLCHRRSVRCNVQAPQTAAVAAAGRMLTRASHRWFADGGMQQEHQCWPHPAATTKTVKSWDVDEAVQPLT